MSMDVISALLIALSGIVIVFIMLVGLCLIIPIISKVVQKIQKKPQAVPVEESITAPAASPAIGAVGGEVILVDVDEKTAACIMAIVSHETGIPLNELIFHKIKAI